MANRTLSVVVSVFNEEDALPLFFTAFDDLTVPNGWDIELLFVNDGSSDSSRSLLEEYAQAHDAVRVINLSRNFGHEAAMIAGVDHALGDGLVCMDVDLQHPLSCLDSIASKLDEGYDVITMVRTANQSAGLIKNLTSAAFYRVINILSDQAHFDPNVSDFFALSARVARVLRKSYREKSRFLRGYIQSVGFRKTSIEYAAAERSAGASHYSIRKLLGISASAIVSFSNVPLKLGVGAGAFCAFLGLVLLVYTLLTHDGAPSGYSTIVVMLCFLFAMMFIVIGVIGEYLAVLFSEIKDRPIYLVDDIVSMDGVLTDDLESDYRV